MQSFMEIKTLAKIFEFTVCDFITWVKVFRIIPEFRILRVTFFKNAELGSL